MYIFLCLVSALNCSCKELGTSKPASSSYHISYIIYHVIICYPCHSLLNYVKIRKKEDFIPKYVSKRLQNSQTPKNELQHVFCNKKRKQKKKHRSCKFRCPGAIGPHPIRFLNGHIQQSHGRPLRRMRIQLLAHVVGWTNSHGAHPELLGGLVHGAAGFDLQGFFYRCTIYKPMIM